jgi:hypothetical protein
MPDALGCMNACHFLGGNRAACGYVASALVLATFSMKSMRPLRIPAIDSNIVLLLYALNMHLQPIFILHGILLPLNILQQLGDAVHRRPALEERLGIF